MRTTTRIMLSLFTASVLALLLFTLTAAFAPAQAVRHAVAGDLPGIEPSGEAPRVESPTCRGSDTIGDPTGPLRSRDRHRTADSAPEAPAGPLLRSCVSTASTPAISGVVNHSVSRRTPAHVPAHVPATLRAFRY